MPKGEKNAAKTECPHGHKLNEENTYIDPRGSRRCRVCARERTNRYLRRVRAGLDSKKLK